MGLRDIFKFRDLPESETSKPFLEHLEDLRWTIVKMSIALVIATMLIGLGRAISAVLGARLFDRRAS